jgi:hypothetical protein
MEWFTQRQCSLYGNIDHFLAKATCFFRSAKASAHARFDLAARHPDRKGEGCSNENWGQVKCHRESFCTLVHLSDLSPSLLFTRRGSIIELCRPQD